ncbi:MAG: hypothetical protein A2Y10_02380 [Planctomycetes bacterium GWF2_41_51]|nr:MAG: hypothetical protein A2Y10_02380 [Planctomycetes bacterium GWF2_41_51]HBG27284.1 hypothetical protein [Phycisphaerales bacterium]
MKNSKKIMQGFTLVELLVVISVIAVLLSILIPTLNKVRDSARSVVCSSNQKQLGLAINLYTEGHDGRLPTAVEYFKRPQYAWYALIYRYVGGDFSKTKTSKADIYVCPTTKAIPGSAKFENTGVSPGFTSGLERISYGVNYGGLDGIMNIEVRNEDRNRPAIEAKFLNSRSMNITQIKNPSSIFLMMDSQLLKRVSTGIYTSQVTVYAPYTPKSSRTGNVSEWPFDRDYDGDGEADSHSDLLRQMGGRYEAPGGAYQYSGQNRHGNNLNTTFVDGHVIKMKTFEWTRKYHWTW